MLNRFENCGCIYVAFGFEYVMFAAHSAVTLKKHNPRLSTTLVTNVPIDPMMHDGVSLFDNVLYQDEPSENNRKSKVAVDQYASYEKTLYLDCDVEIWGDLSPIFFMLDYFDIAVRASILPARKTFELFDGIPATELHLPLWNSGVIAFRRNGKVRQVFELWRNIYSKEGMASDQPAFTRALLGTRDLTIFPLSPVWNAMPSSTGELTLIEKAPHQVRVFHYREPHIRPNVVREIYKDYQALNPGLRPDLCSDTQRGESLKKEQERFELLYYYYSVFTRPLDNRFGRWWMLRQARVFRRLLRFFFVLRSYVRGDDPITPKRDRRGAGKRFAKVKRSSLGTGTNAGP